MGVGLLGLLGLLALCFYCINLIAYFVLFLVCIWYWSNFSFIILPWIHHRWFCFILHNNKLTLLLLLLILDSGALWWFFGIDRICIERRWVFLMMMVFKMFRFSFFFIEFSFPQFINQLMIVSEISKWLFKFAFKDLITELVFLHHHHLIKLPLQILSR